MLALISAAAVALATAAAPSIENVPPADHITVQVVTVNGSGCSQGTAAVAVSSDSTAFTVTYSDYLAAAGGNVRPTDFRKNCQMGLRVRVPHGFTFAIAQVDYRGFAHLAPGATGTQLAGYYFQGNSETDRLRHSFGGPFSDNWQTTDLKEVAELVFAPCGEERILNVNTELRVNAGSSAGTTSFMAMDSADQSIKTKYRFAWKTCF
ncbi:hypothetical protein GCM10011609_87930 [Lentzea pudingi]|uniref:DUF4360 domain-containing protein n=1 Tax=Lentzea pudingi TaxID=1789439 RepID=A0ABQ2IW96_9PSEU|nr:DUF4360 domain-containing protein [Lentzea pudingi]GGN30253.1 hypothetical protein GCM10011609_87930 [Lentzea pudingi]